MFVLRIAEKGFVVLSLVFFTGAITVIMAGGTTSSSSQPDPISKFLGLGIAVVSLLLMVRIWKRVIPLVARGILLGVLIAIIVVSVFWSDAPSTTLSQLIYFLRVSLFGVYLSTRYSLKEQLRLLAWALGIGALLSIIFALALPSYGVMGMGSTLFQQELAHAGAWKGVYGHKNILGRIMVLSTVVFLLVVNSSSRYRWVGWVGFGLSFLLVLGSTSKSALIILLSVLALLPFYRALRWKYTLAVPLFITTILVSSSVAVLLVGNAETILAAFGRDLTFTGRTGLWAAVLDKIWERPWLGYGYGGFWRGFTGESADLYRILTWSAPHSHNGFLDLWLDLGLLGLSAFVLNFIAAYCQAIAWVRQTETGEGLWPLAYLTFLLLYNLSESSLLRQTTLWILYITVTLSMYNKKNSDKSKKTYTALPAPPFHTGRLRTP